MPYDQSVANLHPHDDTFLEYGPPHHPTPSSPHWLVPLWILFTGFATTTRSAHVVEYPKLNTFTVGGDSTDPFSHGKCVHLAVIVDPSNINKHNNKTHPKSW